MAYVTTRDGQRFTAARRRGRRYASRPTAIVRAEYDAASDSLELTLRSGDVGVIPRDRVRELDSVPARALKCMAVSPAGDAISWREFDLDLHATALLRLARR